MFNPYVAGPLAINTSPGASHKASRISGVDGRDTSGVDIGEVEVSRENTPETGRTDVRGTVGDEGRVWGKEERIRSD